MLRPTRRGLILGGSAVTLVGTGHPLIAGRAWAQTLARENPFTLGVASGDPSSDGIVLWTRLATQPLEPGGGMPRRAITIAWEVATDDAMTKPVTRGLATAQPDRAHTLHVELSGLAPGTEYFYRFETGGHRSAVGRTRTFPAVGQEGRVRFASAGCQRYEEGYFTAWRRIAEDRLDFVAHYGDYIYEYNAPIADSTRGLPVVRDMPSAPGKCLTLDDFRQRYAIYKLDVDLQAAHASTPFLASFDDHELENDWASATSSVIGTSPLEFKLRRAAAFQAWFEHMPLRRAQTPRGADIRAHRRLHVGALLQLDILDTRQFRSAKACDGGWAVCPAALASSRTVLGTQQEAWLAQGFKASTAQWNVLAQQVPMARFDRDPDPAILEVHMDKWDGAPAARDRLFADVTSAKLKNLVMLAGDVHQNRASELHQNFDAPTSTPLGVEFTATSISSAGDGRDQPANEAKLSLANPHLKFVNNQRGFVRHTVDSARWQADFVVLDKVTSRDGLARTRQRFVLEAGSSRLVRG